MVTDAVSKEEFKFPLSVPRVREIDSAVSAKMIFIGSGGGVDGRSDDRATSRQVALTRRCESRRRNRRLHLGQRPCEGGIRAGGQGCRENTRQ